MAESIEAIRTGDDVTVLKWGDTVIKVKPVAVQEDVDPDKITKIDLNNLVGEIITAPVLVNRWGNTLAKVESLEKKAKLDFEIWCAEQKEKIREELVAKNTKKPTIGEVDDTLLKKKVYKIKKQKLIDAERDTAIVNSIFWSVKDKSDKLNKLSLTIQREDIDSIEDGIINGVKIVARNID